MRVKYIFLDLCNYSNSSNTIFRDNYYLVMRHFLHLPKNNFSINSSIQNMIRISTKFYNSIKKSKIREKYLFECIKNRRLDFLLFGRHSYIILEVLVQAFVK